MDLAWTVQYIGVIIAALIPAKGKTFYAHLFGAQLMGLGMLLLAFAFEQGFSGAGATVELIMLAAMLVLAALTYLDKRRFIFHELGFIYLNHITIVTAALLIH